MPTEIVPEFIPIQQLSTLTNYAVSTLYDQHKSGKGAFGAYLVKLGPKVGMWRVDYETLKAATQKVKQTLAAQRLSA